MTEQANEVKKVGHRKEREGLVVSAKMQKTIVVAVERRVKHKLYKKFITLRKRYAVHDELGCGVGDRVRIVETRPLSKTKRWRVAERIALGGALPADTQGATS